MANIHFDGPVEVSPSLMQAMWESMTEMARAGYSQAWFARLLTGPVSEQTLTAVARVIFEQDPKLGKDAAKSLREAVAAKCQVLVAENVNVEQAVAIASDEMRVRCKELGHKAAEDRIEGLIAAIPDQMLIDAIKPDVVATVGRIAGPMFAQPGRPGHARLTTLIDQICRECEDEFRTAIRGHLADAAKRITDRAVEEREIQAVAGLKHGGGR